MTFPLVWGLTLLYKELLLSQFFIELKSVFRLGSLSFTSLMLRQLPEFSLAS